MTRMRTGWLLTAMLVLALLATNCVAPAAPGGAAQPSAATEKPVAAAPASGETVTLRITWYDDGKEGEVLRDLLNRFEAKNPDIKIVIDTVPYAKGILETLPLQLEAGQGPDMARVTQLGTLQKYYLDLAPLLSDTKYWEDNFGPFLDWMRPAGSKAIPGLMTQLTVTGPFINRTLFEQAGVPVPSDKSDKVTWEEWAEATNKVAKATQTFAMAMDRSGHRLAGPAISQGAKYLDDQGNPKLVGDEGFKKMAQLMIDWHANGTMMPEIWIGSGGSYVAANEPFINGKLVLYMSGSWQVGQFDTKIGDAFDWEAVPNPCGPAACTGMPGGAAFVGINTTKHPKEVARVMDYLAQEDVLSEFYARTLFIPGHLGLAKKGIDFQTKLPQTQKALKLFSSQVEKLTPLSYTMQGYTYNTILFNATRDRLGQVFAGELKLDDAIQKMQADVDAGIAAAKKK